MFSPTSSHRFKHLSDLLHEKHPPLPPSYPPLLPSPHNDAAEKQNPYGRGAAWPSRTAAPSPTAIGPPLHPPAPAPHPHVRSTSTPLCGPRCREGAHGTVPPPPPLPLPHAACPPVPHAPPRGTRRAPTPNKTHTLPGATAVPFSSRPHIGKGDGVKCPRGARLGVNGFGVPVLCHLQTRPRSQRGG